MVTIVVLAVNIRLYNCECTPVQLSLVERIHNVNGCINNGNGSKWLLYMNGRIPWYKLKVGKSLPMFGPDDD